MAVVAWKVTVTAMQYGQQHQNVLHFTPRTDPINDGMAVCLEIKNNWCNWFRLNVTRDFVFTQIQARDAGSMNVSPTNLAVSLVGAQTPDTNMLGFATWVFQLRSLEAGRHGHGRFYISSVGVGHHVNGVLNSTGAAFWKPAIDPLISRFCANGSGPLQLVLKQRGQTIYRPVVDIIHRADVGCMRTRRVGVGS